MNGIVNATAENCQPTKADTGKLQAKYRIINPTKQYLLERSAKPSHLLTGFTIQSIAGFLLRGQAKAYGCGIFADNPTIYWYYLKSRLYQVL